MYRSFYFYYLVSLFLLSLFFVRLYDESQEPPITLTLQDTLKENSLLEKQQYKSTYQLIEVLDANSTPDINKPVFLGTKQSRGENQSPKQVNSISKVSQLNNEKPSSLQNEVSMRTSFLDQLEKSKQSIIHKASEEQSYNRSTKIVKDFDLEDKTSYYLKGKSVQKLNIQMNQNGEFSVNAMEFEGAEYLIKVAKSIFQHWVDFIPVNMIVLGFIKTDSIGVMQSILLFSQIGNTGKYTTQFTKSFISNNLNQSTLNAFSHYNMPLDNRIRIENLGVELKIYKDTLLISANFEFQLVK